MIDFSKPIKEDKEKGFSLNYYRNIVYNGGTGQEQNNVSAYTPYCYVLTSRAGYCTVYNYNVTNNCQIASFLGFDGILNSSERLPMMQWLYRQLIEQGYNKAQYLIDVKNIGSNVERVEEMFNGHIVFKQPYLSTNGSNMVMFLVKSEALAV